MISSEQRTLLQKFLKMGAPLACRLHWTTGSRAVRITSIDDEKNIAITSLSGVHGKHIVHLDNMNVNEFYVPVELPVTSETLDHFL